MLSFFKSALGYHGTPGDILKFYSNEIKSQPDGVLVEEMLTWRGNYDELEDNHGYIQWLFPTRTYSQFNCEAPPLTNEDVVAMKGDVVIGDRLIRAYELFLDFCGMLLLDPLTGEIGRSAAYAERYHATLETRHHNHLRICRILGCFSVLGFRRYKEPLVRWLEKEAGFAPGAPLRTDGDIPALKLTPHALNMFRTYIREGTPEYVKYSGVRLPEDHSDHAYFSRERRVGEGETGDAGLAVSGGAKGTVGEGAVGGAGGPDEGVVVAADEAMVGEEGGEEGAVALASAAVDAVGASAPADDAVVVAAPPVPPSAAVADTAPVAEAGAAGEQHKAPASLLTHMGSCSSAPVTPTAPIRGTILDFYNNKTKACPDGDTLHEILTSWRGKYDRLEKNHSYIQWLFPTRTFSEFNMFAPALKNADVVAMKADVEIGRRLIDAYRLILEFCGMVLVNEATGEIGRSAAYAERYHATLETREHNHLRICRILGCFSVLGFRRYKEPLVRWLEKEAGYAPDAPLRTAGATPALKLTPHALNMFRTYLRESSPEYVKYSGVRLPEDHSEHAVFELIDKAAREEAGAP